MQIARCQLVIVRYSLYSPNSRIINLNMQKKKKETKIKSFHHFCFTSEFSLYSELTLKSQNWKKKIFWILRSFFMWWKLASIILILIRSHLQDHSFGHWTSCLNEQVWRHGWGKVPWPIEVKVHSEWSHTGY